MTNVVTEDRQLRVYCPTHRINFEVPESARILCESGGHALALDFPHEGFWEYCCDCQVFWPSELDKGAKAKESCPVCTRPTARRYLCQECKLVSIESDDRARRKSFLIGTRGRIEPACPACGKPAGAGVFEHACEEAAASFTTARAKCPFCDDPVRKPEPVPQEERLFCGNCGTQAAASHDFCKNCGHPVGRNAARARAVKGGDSVTAGPSSPYAPGAPPSAPPSIPPEAAAQDGPPGGATSPLLPPPTAPTTKRNAGAVVAVGIGAFVLVLFVVVAALSGSKGNSNVDINVSSGSGFREKMDRALAAGQFFSPNGSCVEDLYDAEAARSPGSSDLAAAATGIRAKLDPIGDDAIQRYYAESDATVDWDYIGKVYGLLKKVAPENREYAARYAYSMALISLKNRSYATAVTNFQDALRNKPDWVMAYNGLGRVYVQDEWTGRDESKTVEYYRKACDLDTNFTWGCRNLGAYYMKVDNWPDAETYMSKALQRSRGRDTIWKAMAKICSKVGKHQDPATGLCSY